MFFHCQNTPKSTVNWGYDPDTIGEFAVLPKPLDSFEVTEDRKGQRKGKGRRGKEERRGGIGGGKGREGNIVPLLLGNRRRWTFSLKTWPTIELLLAITMFIVVITT